MTASLAPIPTPDPATAAPLLARLAGPGCTTAFLAERLGCGRRSASAWARSVGAVQLSHQHLTVWGMPSPERKRLAVLAQDRAGHFGGSAWQGKGMGEGGEGS